MQKANEVNWIPGSDKYINHMLFLIFNTALGHKMIIVRGDLQYHNS